MREPRSNDRSHERQFFLVAGRDEAQHGLAIGNRFVFHYPPIHQRDEDVILVLAMTQKRSHDRQGLDARKPPGRGCQLTADDHAGVAGGQRDQPRRETVGNLKLVPQQPNRPCGHTRPGDPNRRPASDSSMPPVK